MKYLLLAAIAVSPLSPLHAESPKPLKVLLITGGCCHDYKTQKDILEDGLEARANIEITQIHSADGSVKPPLPIFGNPEYAKGFDLVIHDECAAGITDLATIDGVLKPHREDGIPAVNLHCAMHSYRFGDFKKPLEKGADNGHWYEYLGLHSTGHGPQKPIDIHFTEKDSPITKGLEDWTTINEELYNNVAVLTGQSLATGKQGDSEAVVVWTNFYGPKKTRVFSTTIGHNNGTVADDRYLDLVTRGLLWACSKLDKDGKPLAGYGVAAP